MRDLLVLSLLLLSSVPSICGLYPAQVLKSKHLLHKELQVDIAGRSLFYFLLLSVSF